MYVICVSLYSCLRCYAFPTYRRIDRCLLSCRPTKKKISCSLSNIHSQVVQCFRFVYPTSNANHLLSIHPVGPFRLHFHFAWAISKRVIILHCIFTQQQNVKQKKRNKKNKRNAKGTMTSTYCISNSALACVPKNGFLRIIRNIRARAQSGFVRCLRIVYISASLCSSIWLHVFFFYRQMLKVSGTLSLLCDFLYCRYIVRRSILPLWDAKNSFQFAHAAIFAAKLSFISHSARGAHTHHVQIMVRKSMRMQHIIDGTVIRSARRQYAIRGRMWNNFPHQHYRQRKWQKMSSENDVRSFAERKFARKQMGNIWISDKKKNEKHVASRHLSRIYSFSSQFCSAAISYSDDKRKPN